MHHMDSIFHAMLLSCLQMMCDSKVPFFETTMNTRVQRARATKQLDYLTMKRFARTLSPYRNRQKAHLNICAMSFFEKNEF